MDYKTIVRSYTYSVLFDQCFPTLNDKNLDEQKQLQNLFDTSINRLVELGVLILSQNTYNDDVYALSNPIPSDIVLTEFEKTLLGALNLSQCLLYPIMLHSRFDRLQQDAHYIANIIRSYLEEPHKNIFPIIFYVTENTQNLMDKTASEFDKLLVNELGLDCETCTGLVCLKEDKGTSYNDVSNYINAYVASHQWRRPEKMLPPVILARNNTIQMPLIKRFFLESSLDISEYMNTH